MRAGSAIADPARVDGSEGATPRSCTTAGGRPAAVRPSPLAWAASHRPVPPHGIVHSPSSRWRYVWGGIPMRVFDVLAGDHKGKQLHVTRYGRTSNGMDIKVDHNVPVATGKELQWIQTSTSTSASFKRTAKRLTY